MRPERLRIGSFWFRVQWDADAYLVDKDWEGCVLWRSHTIRILSTLEGVDLARVMLHEIAHAIMAIVPGRPSRPTMEQVADAYSIGLVLFWLDNPEVMSWLGSLLREGGEG